MSVPAEFFRAELRVYDNWREGFMRELVQNSVDAGATRIDVTFSTTADGHGRVAFSDDGHGMTRAVLEDVFFALGRSTKTDTDSIGGFGRARIIICFAQESYTVRTGDVLVEGRGGQYTLSHTPDVAPGATFTIDLIDDSPDAVRRELVSLVQSSTLLVPVYVDGQLLAASTLPARAARVLRDEDGAPWARAYLSGAGGNLRVQVKGLPMYHRWISGSDDVIVELVTSRARDVLTASRDQLRGPYAAQLDTFVADLSGNRRAALRDVTEPLDVRVGGGGFLATVAPSPETMSAPDASAGAGEPAELGTPAPISQHAPVTPTAPQFVTLATPQSAAYANARGLLPVAPEGSGQAAPAVPPGLGFDVFLLADARDARVRRLLRSWDPSGWTLTAGSRRRTLLLTWKAAVGYALDTLVALRPELDRVSWTVGWVFDEHTRALHRREDDGHVIALNPVGPDGTAAFRTTRAADRRQLLALAAHEVCHVISDWHGEEFAGLLTDVFAHLDPVASDRVMRTAGR